MAAGAQVGEAALGFSFGAARPLSPTPEQHAQDATSQGPYPSPQMSRSKTAQPEDVKQNQAAVPRERSNDKHGSPGQPPASRHKRIDDQTTQKGGKASVDASRDKVAKERPVRPRNDGGRMPKTYKETPKERNMVAEKASSSHSSYGAKKVTPTGLSCEIAHAIFLLYGA